MTTSHPRDPRPQALAGLFLSSADKRLIRQRIVGSGLNMTRARALFVANRSRTLQPGERAELDQVVARCVEAVLELNASQPLDATSAARRQVSRVARSSAVSVEADGLLTPDAVLRRARGDASATRSLASALRLAGSL